MPKSGMAMEEGVIIKWLKAEGDKIEKGDPVLEVETDKTTMEVESDYSGTLLKILYPEGETIPVTEVIAWIGEPGEEIPETAAAAATAAEPAGPTQTADTTPAGGAAAQFTESGKVKATPAARRIAGEKNIDLASLTPGGNYAEIRAADVDAAGKITATPLAGRIAERDGIDLVGMQGSGRDGKIFSKDIAAAVSAGRAADQRTGGLSLEPERIKLTNIQRVTGKRMFQSHTEIPVVTVNTEADVTELLSVRKKLNADETMHITINDFVIKAVTRALIKNPRLNASIDGNELIIYPNIHLGVAVATPRGLLVPVIRFADQKSLLEISEEMQQIRQIAAESAFSPEDLTGGTFTVSNIGKFGVTSFTPIINQPEAAILGICAVKDRLMRIDGEIVDRKIMGLSLTFDHRIIDGAESAQFIQTLQDLLENPVAALV